MLKPPEVNVKLVGGDQGRSIYRAMLFALVRMWQRRKNRVDHFGLFLGPSINHACRLFCLARMFGQGDLRLQHVTTQVNRVLNGFPQLSLVLSGVIWISGKGALWGQWKKIEKFTDCIEYSESPESLLPDTFYYVLVPGGAFGMFRISGAGMG